MINANYEQRGAISVSYIVRAAYDAAAIFSPSLNEFCRAGTARAAARGRKGHRPMVSRLLVALPWIVLTMLATHLVMSLAQTLMHHRLGHRPLGGKFFRNHVNFHHTYYAKDHLVSAVYLGDEGNNTPYFFIPVFLVGAGTFFLLPLDLFVAQCVACAASFYAHVFFDKEYHVENSWLQRFAWFRHMRELHFVHHRHAGTNFAVIDFYWDRVLGTYRGVEPRPSLSVQAAEPPRS